MKQIAIMQPTYLPYLGYFALMKQVDTFVFLDDVQLERRSWQTRNRILSGQDIITLSVSLQKHKQTDRLDSIYLADSPDWRSAHLNNLTQAYRRAAYFAEGYAFIQDFLTRFSNNARLVDLNIALIATAAAKFGISPVFIRASDLQCGGKRSAHLLEICLKSDAGHYISPLGSKEYMQEEQAFARANLPVDYFTYPPAPYLQTTAGTFEPYMSFIDAVMNIGFAGVAALLTEGAPQ
ncbi:WbqC family protein [Asticcacaulis tiandongensis]|uniref:WbqC family protein n=1 Tax=Asticcacaulis tiandongensis TaxID=2565365 RepID=UPI001FE693F6|nr:WbqC family protein [Asticcacaulis tiandongensis]